jgi:hypothetical protein
MLATNHTASGGYLTVYREEYTPGYVWADPAYQSGAIRDLSVVASGFAESIVVRRVPSRIPNSPFLEVRLDFWKILDLLAILTKLLKALKNRR